MSDVEKLRKPLEKGAPVFHGRSKQTVDSVKAVSPGEVRTVQPAENTDDRVGGTQAAPKRTDTNFETPGSCIVTPYITGAMLIVFLLWVMSTN